MSDLKVGDTVLVNSGRVRNCLAVVKAKSKRTSGLTVRTAEGVEYHVMPYEVKKATAVELLGV